MTEDEAKTKWCPFLRLAEGATRCRASDCMAWRQLGWVPVDMVRAARKDHGLSFDEAVAKVREQVSREPGEHGYCGLAGLPS